MSDLRDLIINVNGNEFLINFSKKHNMKMKLSPNDKIVDKDVYQYEIVYRRDDGSIELVDVFTDREFNMDLIEKNDVGYMNFLGKYLSKNKLDEIADSKLNENAYLGDVMKDGNRYRRGKWAYKIMDDIEHGDKENVNDEREEESSNLDDKNTKTSEKMSEGKENGEENSSSDIGENEKDKVSDVNKSEVELLRDEIKQLRESIDILKQALINEKKKLEEKQSEVDELTQINDKYNQREQKLLAKIGKYEQDRRNESEVKDPDNLYVGKGSHTIKNLPNNPEVIAALIKNGHLSKDDLAKHLADNPKKETILKNIKKNLGRWEINDNKREDR